MIQNQMTTEQKIQQLGEVVEKRLPYVKRWRAVSVHRKPYSVIVHWNGVKKDNSGWHKQDVRVPIWELDNYLARQKRKLRECR